MCGFKICGDISNDTFVILHKTLNPYTAKICNLRTLFLCVICEFFLFITSNALVRLSPGAPNHRQTVYLCISLLRLHTTKHQIFPLLALCGGNPLVPDGSTPKGSVMRKVFPCDDGIIVFIMCVSITSENISTEMSYTIIWTTKKLKTKLAMNNEV